MRSHFSISLTGGWQVAQYQIQFGDRWRGNDFQLVIIGFDITFFDALGDRSQEFTVNVNY